MKKWLLWTSICTVCAAILLYTGSFFSYTGNKIKISVPIRIFEEDEYVSWEEKEIKENPDYDNLTIFIDINAKRLELIHLDDHRVIKRYPIASGKKDTPSPIGNWTIIGKARWGEGFGTRWLGLDVPWGTF
ncbi:L,D-transpeptidase [Thermotalea metallivorans]|uniref:L,D-TPase catalytic domain-containing protein n=1 Tax=Thermotalea metallivorans TaxID=520762 RepID=A0A140LA10_9FIRM|nr:L,D-transpeptidase [Thermotalea metallivorans]KXG77385.1 hypothetical protein AN619_05110 [Thermotalea metallivorans]